MVTPWGNKGVAWRKRWCKEQCQVHEGEEGHARPGLTTSRRGQDSPWKSQSEWQRTEINAENTSMVWPTLGSRTANEQNRNVSLLPSGTLSQAVDSNWRLETHLAMVSCIQCRCNKRLQRLPKFLISTFVIFVNVYYFNKRHTKCRKIYKTVNN